MSASRPRPTGPSRRELLRAAATTGLLGACAGPRPDAASEGEGDGHALTLAGYEYDRVAALADGRLGVEGYATRFQPAGIYELNAVAMGGDQRWEVQEIGLHPYMLAFANEGLRDYTLVPVFPLRTFRHKSVYVRTDRGIETPADLRGRKVATAGYSQSSLTWIRGLLQHQYGVRPDQLDWVLARASSDDGVASRNEVVVPEGVPARAGPPGVDESELLVTGEVDAVFSAVPPRAFVEGDPRVARLFPDSRAVERAYFAETGIFPIMHVVAVRSDAVERDPGLPRAVFEAYSAAKARMYAALADKGWAMISLPWLAAELEATRALMGDNYWPYGIAPNVGTLEALFQYSHEQGLASRELTVEELFHPSTLALLE